MPQLDWAIDIIPSPSGSGAAFQPKLVYRLRSRALR